MHVCLKIKNVCVSCIFLSTSECSTPRAWYDPSLHHKRTGVPSKQCFVLFPSHCFPPRSLAAANWYLRDHVFPTSHMGLQKCITQCTAKVFVGVGVCVWYACSLKGQKLYTVQTLFLSAN